MTSRQRVFALSFRWALRRHRPMAGIARGPRVRQDLVEAGEHGAVAAALLGAQLRGQRELQDRRHGGAHLRPHPPLAQRLQHRPDVLRLVNVGSARVSRRAPSLIGYVKP